MPLAPLGHCCFPLSGPFLFGLLFWKLPGSLVSIDYIFKGPSDCGDILEKDCVLDTVDTLAIWKGIVEFVDVFECT